jgi:hypothetical protein
MCTVGNYRLAWPLLLVTSAAWAGPPLSLDDPGILPVGGWEANIALQAVSTDAGKWYQQPLLDASIGLGANTQAGVGIPYVSADPDQGPSRSDWGNLNVNAKWRFYDGDRLQLAVNPRYDFGVSDRRAAEGLGDAGDVLGLPVTMEYAAGGAWRLGAEVAREVVDGGEDGWFYAGMVGYRLNGPLELQAELSGNADTGLGEDALDARIGADVMLGRELHLLFSLGTGVRQPGGAEDVDWECYLGLQFFL